MVETSIRHDTSPNGDKTDCSATFQYTFIASGPKFRGTRELLSSTETNPLKLSEAAFNGTSFVDFTRDTRMMTRQSEVSHNNSGELQENPLVAPFLFLAKNSDDCPGCRLRFTDIIVPDFAKGLLLPKAQHSNGLFRISMPGLPIGQKPTSWKIDLDESGDSFTPKKITIIIEAGGELTYTLLNYTNLHGYQFPTIVKSVHTVYPPTSPPTVVSEGTVTVSSVRVPENIPDSTFEIDENSAAVAWDADTHRLVEDDGSRAGLNGDGSYMVSGAISYTAYGAGSNILARHSFFYSVEVGESAWYIRTAPRTITQSESVRLNEIGSDGTNVYTLTKLNPDFGKGSAPAAAIAKPPNNKRHVQVPDEAPWNGAVAAVYRAVAPPGDLTLAAPLWLAYASHLALSVSTDSRLPRAWVNTERYNTNTTRVTWNALPGPPGLPQHLSYFNDGVRFRETPDKRVEVLLLPPPYNAGYVEAIYEVTSVTNLDNLVLPAAFRLRSYGPNRGGTSTEQTHLRTEVEGYASSVARSFRTNFLPEISARTAVQDNRVAVPGKSTGARMN